MNPVIEAAQDRFRRAPGNASLALEIAGYWRSSLRPRTALLWYRHARHLGVPDRTVLPAIARCQTLACDTDDARETWDEIEKRFPDPALALSRLTQCAPIQASAETITRLHERTRGALAALRRLPAAIDSGEPPPWIDAPMPFYFSYHGLDTRTLFEQVSATARHLIPGLRAGRGPTTAAPRSGRIRVGFATPHHDNHTIAKLYVGLLRNLDRDRIQTWLITHLPLLSRRADDSLIPCTDQQVYVPKSLDEIHRQVAALGLDVLILPHVGMGQMNSLMAYRRMAPVQVASWGNPDTGGIDTVDHYLSCDAFEPAGAEANYTESLVRLQFPPACIAADQGTQPDADTRRTWGMVPGVRTYGCPQSLFKLHPEFDRYLADLLRADAKGVVLLIEPRESAWRKALLARLGRTLDSEELSRVRFLPRLPNDQFIGLLACCDVLLDPLHFGCGGTAYQAFSVGTPIITQPGNFLRSRIVAGLYEQMGIEGLTASNREEYVALALAVAEPEQRAAYSKAILEAGYRIFSTHSAVREFEDWLVMTAERTRSAQSDIAVTAR